jgi:hypothetical protein
MRGDEGEEICEKFVVGLIDESASTNSKKPSSPIKLVVFLAVLSGEERA